jgi:hypothetical protein
VSSSLISRRDPVFQLWSDAIDGIEISFTFDEARLLMAMEDCYMSLVNVIFPYLGNQLACKGLTSPDKDVEKKIDRYAKVFLDKEFITEFYTDTKWDAERQELWKILRVVWEDTFTQTDGLKK